MEETLYERYMRRRADLIKEGKGLPEATDRAYVETYCSKDKPDLMSYKDR